MNYKFEELPITINNRKFLVDGELELEDDPFDDAEIVFVDWSVSYAFEIEKEQAIDLNSFSWRELEDTFHAEFYKADSPLYNDALQFWEDRK